MKHSNEITIGDLTRNLSRHEFACPCCGADTVDAELLEAVQMTVDDFQVMCPDMEIKIEINSANRCPEYNATIKGSSPTSRHTWYQAIDFYLYDKKTGKQISDDEVADYLEKKYPDKYGIGRYPNRTHLDIRALKTRWDRR